MKTQNQLIEKYRTFFEWVQELPKGSPIMPIQFGIECGSGWYMLLDELMSEIQHHIENINRNRKHEPKFKFIRWLRSQGLIIPWHHKLRKIIRLELKIKTWFIDLFPKGKKPMLPINITQIKEKFGGLRFYYNGGDNEIDGMVRLAESLSYKICEYCGTTINVGMTQKWYSTICGKCREEESNRKNLEWIKNEN